MFKHKKYAVLAASVLVLAACGGTSETSTPSGDSTTSTGTERIRLQVWGPQKEGEKEMYEYFAAEFQALHPEIDFRMSYGDVGEADAATNALADVDTAADIFMFADDQLPRLVQKGVLAPLSDYYGNMVKDRDLQSSVDSATFVDPTDDTEKLFAFPVSADNGYFLYYNNEFFTETDVETLEGIMAKTSADHQFAMDLGNGYYAMSPVMNTGEITYDFETELHTTTYNQKVSVDAMQGFIDILRPKVDTGFKSINLDEVLQDFSVDQDETIVAGVTGVWNADNLETYLGEKYAATKLPTFTSADESTVQMGSFAGSKLVGVKSSAQNQAWAFSFAEFITNEAAQAYRYAEIGKGPSNEVVSASDAVQANEALAALAMQSDHSIPQGQSVGSTFWDAGAAVGNFVVNGPASEDAPQTTQEQLDAFVSAITMTA